MLEIRRLIPNEFITKTNVFIFILTIFWRYIFRLSAGVSCHIQGSTQSLELNPLFNRWPSTSVTLSPLCYLLLGLNLHLPNDFTQKNFLNQTSYPLYGMSIRTYGEGSVKAPMFDMKQLRKSEGSIGWNTVSITIYLKKIVLIFLVLKIIKFHLRNLERIYHLFPYFMKALIFFLWNFNINFWYWYLTRFCCFLCPKAQVSCQLIKKFLSKIEKKNKSLTRI